MAGAVDCTSRTAAALAGLGEDCAALCFCAVIFFGNGPAALLAIADLRFAIAVLRACLVPRDAEVTALFRAVFFAILRVTPFFAALLCAGPFFAPTALFVAFLFPLLASGLLLRAFVFLPVFLTALFFAIAVLLRGGRVIVLSRASRGVARPANGRPEFAERVSVKPDESGAAIRL
jgi:hypothetical protein